jgi:hypothetical protein
VLADTQTFALLLYDPRHYPTLTGDGPVLFQYLEVRNDDSIVAEDGHNYATVGIESPDHGDGLEYTFADSYPAAAAVVVPNRAIRFTTNPPDTFTAIRDGQPALGPRAGCRVLPNPARRRVRVHLPDPGAARTLRVFDVMGREVRAISVGTGGLVEWDLRDRQGRRVRTGVYQLEVRSQKAEGRSRMPESLRVVVLDE